MSSAAPLAPTVPPGRPAAAFAPPEGPLRAPAPSRASQGSQARSRGPPRPGLCDSLRGASPRLGAARVLGSDFQGTAPVLRVLLAVTALLPLAPLLPPAREAADLAFAVWGMLLGYAGFLHYPCRLALLLRGLGRAGLPRAEALRDPFLLPALLLFPALLALSIALLQLRLQGGSESVLAALRWTGSAVYLVLALFSVACFRPESGRRACGEGTAFLVLDALGPEGVGLGRTLYELEGPRAGEGEDEGRAAPGRARRAAFGIPYAGEGWE